MTWDVQLYAAHESRIARRTTDLEYTESLGGPVVFEHPPMFLDVAVDRRAAPYHWIWAAVDHLGVVGFDLSATWNDSISGAAFFHEGVQDTSANGKQFVRLVPDPGGTLGVRTFARRVQVVDTPPGVQAVAGSALVVTTEGLPFLKAPGILNPGRCMDYLADNLNGILDEAVHGDFQWGEPYTICYDLNDRVNSGWSSGAIHSSGRVDIGGQIFVPEEQQPDSLLFYAGWEGFYEGWPNPEVSESAVRQNLARAEYLAPPAGSGWPLAAGTSPPAPDRGTYREKVYRHGRWVYRATFNEADPTLLALGNNDAGLPADGPLTLDLSDSTGAKIVANHYYPPNPPGVFDKRNKYGTNGVVFGETAAVAQSGYEYRFGQRRCLVGSKYKMRWRLAKFDPATATEVKAIFFTMPPDKFTSPGYYLYGGGSCCALYDNHAGDGNTYLFASAFSTPQGIWVLKMNKLIEFIDGPSTQHDQRCDLEDPQWHSAVTGELTTHPEFWNIPDCRFGSPPADAVDFLYEQEINTSVQTYYPHFFQLPSSGSGPPDTWMLAVPSVIPGCDEQLPIFMSHPSWMPEAEFQSGAGYERMMVRFFNIDDPLKFSEATSTRVGSPDLPAFTILGPDDSTAGTHIKTAHVQDDLGEDRYFCFVADLGGHLEVFEITNLLRHSPDTPLTNPADNQQYGATLSPTPFASYTALDALCDENPSNSFGLEVDHAVWTDEFEVKHDEVYVYFSVLRVGIEVLRFDVDAAQPEDRLEWLELIQTPGEVGFLNIAEKPGGLTDTHGHIRDKVLFVGDGTAGFRIYTYSF